MFAGYFKNDAKTNETIDEDGWLHTGDVGTWTEWGTLKIIDRKSQIVKLSQGEYVAPEKIENVYSTSAYVAQCYVDGDAMRDYLLAVVVPNIDAVNKWSLERKIPLSIRQACRHGKFKSAVLEDMHALGRREGLNALEQVRDVYLHPEPFGVENGLLTPTMKIKRSVCRQFFKPLLEQLYDKIDADRMNVVNRN